MGKTFKEAYPGSHLDEKAATYRKKKQEKKQRKKMEPFNKSIMRY